MGEQMFDECKKVSFRDLADTIDEWLTEEWLMEALKELGFERDNEDESD